MTRLTFVYILHSLYIVCMYKKHTFQVSSRFQSELFTCFVDFVHFLYICRNFMYIFLYSLSHKMLICNIFVYKICTNLMFFITFVQILYSLCSNFSVSVTLRMSKMSSNIIRNNNMSGVGTSCEGPLLGKCLVGKQHRPSHHQKTGKTEQSKKMNVRE